jgi:hypothetical protein
MNHFNYFAKTEIDYDWRFWRRTETAPAIVLS